MDNDIEIYRELLKVSEGIGSLTANVESIKELIESQVKVTDALDARVVVLEAAGQRQAGGAKVLTFIVSIVAGVSGFLGYLFKSHH